VEFKRRILTLNLGFRYECAAVPIEPHPALAFSVRDPLHDAQGVPGRLFANPSLHNVSPRIGFAWDVTGKGKTSIRGGAGIYYDTGNYGGLMLSNGVATPPVFDTLTITSTSLTPNPAFSVPLPTSGSLEIPLSARGVYFNLQQPTLLQHSLEIDQRLPWNMALSVGYIGSRGWHLEQEEEGNPPLPVGTAANSLPIYGCWNAAQTQSQLPGANGACATGFTSVGPRGNTALTNVLMTINGGDSYYNACRFRSPSASVRACSSNSPTRFPS
jgi:hypothetical protein